PVHRHVGRLRRRHVDGAGAFEGRLGELHEALDAAGRDAQHETGAEVAVRTGRTVPAGRAVGAGRGGAGQQLPDGDRGEAGQPVHAARAGLPQRLADLESGHDTGRRVRVRGPLLGPGGRGRPGTGAQPRGERVAARAVRRHGRPCGDDRGTHRTDSPRGLSWRPSRTTALLPPNARSLFCTIRTSASTEVFGTTSTGESGPAVRCLAVCGTKPCRTASAEAMAPRALAGPVACPVIALTPTGRG